LGLEQALEQIKADAGIGLDSQVVNAACTILDDATFRQLMMADDE
jgi:hypothetical protein